MLNGSLNRREVWGEWIHALCMDECLCCPPETITTLLSSSTSIQNKKFKKKKKKEASQLLRQGILLLLAADIIQDPKEIPEALTLFLKYCLNFQINLTINLLSGHCPFICVTSTYFLDKWTLIFLNQVIFQLCVSV